MRRETRDEQDMRLETTASHVSRLTSPLARLMSLVSCPYANHVKEKELLR